MLGALTKSSKLIATLGVVAGITVAAFPLGVFADQTPQTVSGSAELFVEVQPAIAMTITGNNDDRSHATSDSYQYAIVTPAGTENPSEEEWYEKSGDTYTATEDTTVTAGKTYFEQSTDTTGVDVFAPTIGDGVVDGRSEAFKVGPSSSYMEILPNSIGTMTSTVTVYTNNTTGYNLNVKDADATVNLTSTDTGVTDVIAANASPAAGQNRWSIEGGNLSKSAMVASTDTALAIKNTSTRTTTGDATIMTYTVSTSETQQAGVYSDTIVYTATTN